MTEVDLAYVCDYALCSGTHKSPNETCSITVTTTAKKTSKVRFRTTDDNKIQALIPMPVSDDPNYMYVLGVWIHEKQVGTFRISDEGEVPSEHTGAVGRVDDLTAWINLMRKFGTV